MTSGDVRIRWMRPSRLGGFGDREVGPLGEAQARRLAATPPARRAAFLAGRALIHRALRDAGDDIAITSECPRCGGDHGAVRAVSGATLLSVAHAADLVVVAAAPATAGALGVDVEWDDAPTRRRLRETAVLFGAGRAPDVAGWTRLEAVLKADGRGVRVDPATIRWRVNPEGWRARVPGRPASFMVRRLPGPPGAVVSAAVSAAVGRAGAPAEGPTGPTGPAVAEPAAALRAPNDAAVRRAALP